MKSRINNELNKKINKFEKKKDFEKTILKKLSSVHQDGHLFLLNSMQITFFLIGDVPSNNIFNYHEKNLQDDP